MIVCHCEVLILWLEETMCSVLSTEINWNQRTTYLFFNVFISRDWCTLLAKISFDYSFEQKCVYFGWERKTVFKNAKDVTLVLWRVRDGKQTRYKHGFVVRNENKGDANAREIMYIYRHRYYIVGNSLHSKRIRLPCKLVRPTHILSFICIFWNKQKMRRKTSNVCTQFA